MRPDAGETSGVLVADAAWAKWVAPLWGCPASPGCGGCCRLEPWPLPPLKPSGGQDRMGSLAGAAHLLNHNAGVLRGTHGEQKSPVEQKGKSPLDFDFQCEYKP